MTSFESPSTGSSRGALSLLDGGPFERQLAPDTGCLYALLEAAAAGGELLTFVDAEGGAVTRSYRELSDRALRAASRLERAGARPGTLLVLQMGSDEAFLTAFWACMALGATAVPLAPARSTATASKLRVVGKLLTEAVVVCSPELVDNAAEAVSGALGMVVLGEDVGSGPVDFAWRSHTRPPDSVAVLLPTSGSTSSPKLVAQSHAQLLARAEAAARYAGLGRGHVALNWLPLDHVGGLIMLHVQHVLLGTRQILADPEYVLPAPLRWLDLIQAHGVRASWAPNFAFRAVVRSLQRSPERRWDLSSLDHLINGGELISLATLRAFCELLRPSGLRPSAIRPAWGMSETGSLVVADLAFDPRQNRDAARPVSVGKPIPGVTIRIVDDRGELLPHGCKGRLHVKGVGLTAGYWGKPDLTRAAFTEDGWLITGDVGWIEAGSLIVSGRGDDLIIINGANLHPSEVEEAIDEDLGTQIATSVAVGFRRPGDDSDQLAVFFVPESAAHDVEELSRRLRACVSRAVGRSISLLVHLSESELPVTATGKIQRNALKQRLQSGLYGDGLPASPHEPREPRIFEPRWVAGDDDVSAGVDAFDIEVSGSSTSQARELTVLLQRRGLRAFSAPAPATSRHAAVFVHLVARGEPARSAADAARGWLPTLLGAKTQLAAAARGAMPPGTTLLLVTFGAQRVTDGDLPDGVQLGAAGVWGTARVLQNERPELRLRLVDLDPEASLELAARMLHDAIGHACSGAREQAFRAQQRYVRRLVPLDHPEPQRVLLDGTTLLITGGFGQLATLVARRFAARGVQRIVLAGHRPPSEAAAARVAELRAVTGIAVDAEVMDVTDLDQVRALFHRLSHEGPPLGVIVHAAGTQTDSSVRAMTADSVREAVEARALGLFNLHLATRELSYRALVAFSSVVGLLGYPGTASYAAACEMQQGIIDLMRREGKPAYAVSWSAWSSAQGHARTTADHSASVGVRPIDPQSALDVLEQLISQRPAHHVVLDLDPVRWLDYCPAAREQALLAALMDRSPARAALQSCPPDPEAAKALRVARRSPDHVREALLRHLGDVLQLPSATITPECRFDDLGLSSMAQLELRERVHDELGVMLSPGFCWRYPDVSSLLTHLAAQSGEG